MAIPDEEGGFPYTPGEHGPAHGERPERFIGDRAFIDRGPLDQGAPKLAQLWLGIPLYVRACRGEREQFGRQRLKFANSRCSKRLRKRGESRTDRQPPDCVDFARKSEQFHPQNLLCPRLFMIRF